MPLWGYWTAIINNGFYTKSFSVYLVSLSFSFRPQFQFSYTVSNSTQWIYQPAVPQLIHCVLILGQLYTVGQ